MPKPTNLAEFIKLADDSGALSDAPLVFEDSGGTRIVLDPDLAPYEHNGELIIPVRFESEA